MTRAKLERHKNSILKEMDLVTFERKGLNMMVEYHLHCLEGIEKGYNIEPSTGMKVKKETAKNNKEKQIGSIRHKLQGCMKREEYLLHQLEGIRKDIQNCGNPNPTGKRGRPKKVQ